MSRIIIALIIIGGYLLIDIYAFSGFDFIFDSDIYYRVAYVLLSVLVLSSFYKISSDLQSNFGVRSPITNFLIGFAFAVFVAKLLFCFLLLTQDGLRTILAVINVLSGWMGQNILSTSFPERHWDLTAGSGVLASIPFVVMIYGITRGKYKYKVDQVELSFSDLPESFDGFSVAQISDIHAGSFDSIRQVEKGVDMLQNLGADVVLFTGDLVNSHKDEIDPYMDIFSKLKAPHGMYSVTGNHDYYGAYRYGSPAAKETYWEDFFKKHEEIGFTILNNRNVKIHKGGEAITIAGVENWGAGPFPKRGNLDRGLSGIDDHHFTILMSHDPTHWDHHIIPHPQKVHLTLSGHTHAMQFGINWLGFKWSPVQYRYKQWMGLYQQSGQYLYVNRGFGFLGFPGRVGMSPEITLFTLRKKIN